MSTETVLEPVVLIVFGAEGDLTWRKLVPALYALSLDGALPERFAMIGLDRKAGREEDWQARLRDGVAEFTQRSPVVPEVWNGLARRLTLRQSKFASLESYRALASQVQSLEAAWKTQAVRVLYLAVPPTAVETIVRNLGSFVPLMGAHVDTNHPYIIVGSGLAGISAAEGIRERDAGGSILVLGRELDVPYDRPPLTKQLWFGKKTLENVLLQSRAWYDEKGIELLAGRVARQVDLPGKAVIDDKGDRHGYRKLLLATGGEPRRLAILGGDLEGICYYRTLADYRRIRSQVQPGTAALIIGGGFIGSELAAALCHVGAKVTMLFPQPYLGHRIFPEALGRSLQRLFQGRGIRILNGDLATSIVRKADRFLTNSRSGDQVPSDLVIAGIGIHPSAELAQAAGLATDDGVVANERLQTANPDVFVAGDCARFPYAALGRSMRVEHWDNAQIQGRQAGRNMAGEGAPYLHMPYFFSDLFEFGYEAVGDVSTRLETFADWQEEYRKGVVYYLGDGRVRGAMMCNVWDKVEAARQMIRAGKLQSPASLRGAIR